MLDLPDVEMEVATETTAQESVPTSDKLEIPQDVIDSISNEEDSKKDSEK